MQLVVCQGNVFYFFIESSNANQFQISIQLSKTFLFFRTANEFDIKIRIDFFINRGNSNYKLIYPQLTNKSLE